MYKTTKTEKALIISASIIGITCFVLQIIQLFTFYI